MATLSSDQSVLTMTPEGEYGFTPYGEFLSYYHTHLQIFNLILSEKYESEDSKKDIYNQLKHFMKENIHSSEHFFDQIGEFAKIINMDADELTTTLQGKFFNVLAKVQEKLKKQEIEKLSDFKNRKFARITEELVARFGEIIPAGSRFTSQNNLFVIENTITKEVLEPSGMMKEVKNAQDALNKKEDDKSPAVFERSTPKNYVEKPIFTEILTLYGDILTGQKLSVKGPNELLEEKNQAIIKSKEPPQIKSKSLLEDVDDIEIETQDDAKETNSSIVGTDDIEVDLTDVSAPAASAGNFDLDSFLTDVQEEAAAEDLVEEIPTDEIDEYSYKEYSEVIKLINQYKTSNDNTSYKKWLQSTGNIEKSIISLKIHLAKEKSGEKVLWENVYESIASKAEFSEEQIKKLNNKIQHFEDVKLVLNQVINQFKAAPPNTLNFVKTNWTSILQSFNGAPDYELVKERIEEIISKSNSPEIKSHLSKVLMKSIDNLKIKLNK